MYVQFQEMPLLAVAYVQCENIVNAACQSPAQQGQTISFPKPGTRSAHLEVCAAKTQRVPLGVTFV